MKIARGRDYACSDAGLEVATDALGDRGGAAIGLEALEVELEPLGALPEVGVVDPAAVGVDRVDHLEESALEPGRLGRRVQGGRARALAGQGKWRKTIRPGRAASSGQAAAQCGQARSA